MHDKVKDRQNKFLHHYATARVLVPTTQPVAQSKHATSGTQGSSVFRRVLINNRNRICQLHEPRRLAHMELFD